MPHAPKKRGRQARVDRSVRVSGDARFSPPGSAVWVTVRGAGANVPAGSQVSFDTKGDGGMLAGRRIRAGTLVSSAQPTLSARSKRIQEKRRRAAGS